MLRAAGAAGGGPHETRVSGIASDTATNRCSSTGATLRRFAWSSGGCRRPRPPIAGSVMFVELHAQSAFTFLEGADQPEALVAEAARRDMPALALVDRA